jgi:hypothetical protein
MTVTEPAARLLLQRLLLLIKNVHFCTECVSVEQGSCESHELAWKRLERDARKALGEPGAN